MARTDPEDQSGTTEASPVESLADPESLTDRDDVEIREVPKAVDEEKLASMRERAETIDGVVVVGVTTDDGEVLLVKPDERGWRPVGGGVEPGEDWAAAARRNAREETGLDVVLDRPELLKRYRYRLEDEDVNEGESKDEGVDESEAKDEYRISEDFVFFRASSADGEAATSRVDGRDDAAVEWFDDVPADANPREEDAIRLFLES